MSQTSTLFIFLYLFLLFSNKGRFTNLLNGFRAESKFTNLFCIKSDQNDFITNINIAEIYVKKTMRHAEEYQRDQVNNGAYTLASDKSSLSWNVGTNFIIIHRGSRPLERGTYVAAILAREYIYQSEDFELLIRYHLISRRLIARPLP